MSIAPLLRRWLASLIAITTCIAVAGGFETTVSLATADLDAEVGCDLPYDSVIGISDAVKRGGYSNSAHRGYQIISLLQTTKG